MKKIGLALLFLVVVGTYGCITAMSSYKNNPSLAVYDGRIHLPGLQHEVHVYRGQYGVPHIFAENERDLFYAIGYVQAQDRLWEMILLRAFAEGRTAELLGRLKIPGASFKGFPIDTLTIDRMQRTMGMKFLGEVGEALLKEYQPEAYSRLQAYSNGINHFIETHREWEELPVEFQILRARPELWRPADTITFGRLMGFILGYNMMFELFRYGLSEKYGEDLAWEAAPLHESYGPTVVPPEYLKNKLKRPRNLPAGGRPPLVEMGYKPLDLSGEAALDMLAAYDGISKSINPELPFASNNWIVSGKMTTTGTPMLANDTHLPHMEPSIWYMSHVKAGDINSYGVMFPGTPFHALGHTRKLAWAATTSIADVQDLYVETVNPDRPGKYLYKGQWRPFTVRRERFRVRHGSRFTQKEVEIRQSIHGPVLSDFLPLPPNSPPVALRWVAWDFCRNLKVFEALVQSRDVAEFMDRVRAMPEGEFELMNISVALVNLMKGESIGDFIGAMDQVVLPNQNWSAADASGNIIYLPGGLVPIRNKGIGVMPVPGASGEFDWVGFIPLMELPHMKNPERGYIASANNEVVDMEWYPHVFSTNFDSGWRAWRVEELIKELAPLDMKDMKRIQNDIFVIKARTEVPLILAAFENKDVTDRQALKGYELLKDWDYMSNLPSVATPVFFKWAEEMRRNVFADEVSKEDFERFLKESHADIPIEIMCKRGESFLFDDKSTPAVVEDMDDMLIKSVKDAVAFMEKRYGRDTRLWSWGRVHPVKFFHPLGFGPFKELSVGPFIHVGSRHTLRCASPAESGRWHFKATYGPAWRHIIDLGDPDHALGVIDGSISGQWLSPHYDDLHMVWLKGDHLTMTMDPEEVVQEAKYHLVLMP